MSACESVRVLACPYAPSFMITVVHVAIHMRLLDLMRLVSLYAMPLEMVTYLAGLCLVVSEYLAAPCQPAPRPVSPRLAALCAYA